MTALSSKAKIQARLATPGRPTEVDVSGLRGEVEAAVQVYLAAWSELRSSRAFRTCFKMNASFSTCLPTHSTEAGQIMASPE